MDVEQFWGLVSDIKEIFVEDSIVSDVRVVRESSGLYGLRETGGI